MQRDENDGRRDVLSIPVVATSFHNLLYFGRVMVFVLCGDMCSIHGN